MPAVSFELATPSRVLVSGDITEKIVKALPPTTTKLNSAKSIEFDLDAYPAVLRASQITGCKVDPIPQLVLDAMKRKYPVVSLEKVPASILNNALPFQLEGIQFGLARNGRCFLAHEPGLGKTIQSLGIVSALCTRNILVLAPPSVCDNWIIEIKKWTDFGIHKIVGGKSPINFQAQVVVCSFDTAKTRKDVCEHVWGAIIFDESHALKGHDTLRSKTLGPILQRTPFVILLSGTPQLALPAELYVQFSAMIHPAKMTYKEFTKRYCGGCYNRFGAWEAREAEKTRELALVLRTFMIRRLASEVLTQLPPKTREVVGLVLPPSALAELAQAREKLEEAKRRMVASLHETSKRAKYDVETLKQATMAFWRTGARVKAPYVVEYLQTRPNEKIAVFCHHESLRTAILAAFPEAVCIYGGTPVSQRQGIIERLADPSSPTRMGVFSITACSTGLNMTPGVTHVVIAEPIWTPSTSFQAENRAHRIGATQPILVTYLDAQGSMDSRVLEMNMKKLDVNNSVLGSGSSMDMQDGGSCEFRGAEFLRLGVCSNFARVDPSCSPLQGEKQGEWVRRVCIQIDPEDFIDTIEKRVSEEEVREFKSLEFCNPGTEIWLLVRAPLAEIERMKSKPTSFERSEAAGCFDLCCAFT